MAIGISLLFMLSCTSRKSQSDIIDNVSSVVEWDSIATDTIHHPSPDEFEDGHMPPPPPDSGKFDGHRPPPPPDGKDFDGPPPPPPGGKRPDGPPHKDGRPPHKPDNMRGFDPAFEDDMDDNGMSRYMENNDEEGWD